MIGTIPTTTNGKPTIPKSDYAPQPEVVELLNKIRKDYQIGYNIQHRSFTGFNDRNLITTLNDCQKKWNNYVQPKSDNPEESWRWQGIRPMSRNKVISIGAHITARLLIPNVFAQNESDEEDKDASSIMRDMLKWNIQNSDYEINFLFGVLAAAINPVCYFNVEFVKAMQDIKKKAENGEITKEEIEDEVLSGMKFRIYGGEEILISNPYVPPHKFQTHRFVIKRRYIGYDTAEALYKDHKDWGIIRPSIKILYSQDDDTFYENFDEDLNGLCEEITYYNRREDTEIVCVNGVYLGDDNVDNNPIKHRDNRNRPKYQFVPMIYEMISENFFAGKSLVDKLSPDQDLIDTMWRMVMDGTFLQVMPALAIMGSDEDIPQGIVMPGSVTPFDENTKIENISSQGNLQAGWNSLAEIERSMNEASQSPRQAGQQEGGQQTAYEVARLEQNARTQLGLFGRMVALAVKDMGELTIDLIIHNQTIAQSIEMIGGRQRMRYASFLLKDETENGKKVSKKIEFSSDLLSEMPEEQIEQRKKDLFKREGGLEGKMRIYQVNPSAFAKLKYFISVNVDALLPQNEAYEKLFKLEGYDRMIQNPTLDQVGVTKDFLVEVFAKGESDKYMKKNDSIVPMPQMPQTGGRKQLPNESMRNEAMAGILPT